MSFGKPYKITIRVDHRLHERLVAEIAARGGKSVSATIGDLLSEHFELMDELAHTLEAGSAPGEAKQGRIIHHLLAETESRLENSIDRQGKRLAGVRAEIAELRTMFDQALLSLLIHLPEVPVHTREAALSSANVRHGKWRRAVEKLLEDGGVAPLRIKT